MNVKRFSQTITMSLSVAALMALTPMVSQARKSSKSNASIPIKSAINVHQQFAKDLSNYTKVVHAADSAMDKMISEINGKSLHKDELLKVIRNIQKQNANLETAGKTFIKKFDIYKKYVRTNSKSIEADPKLHHLADTNMNSSYKQMGIHAQVVGEITAIVDALNNAFGVKPKEFGPST